MWNYRLVNGVDEESDERCIILAEVYYDDTKTPYGWCNATVTADSRDEAERVYAMMFDAFKHPILQPEDFTGDPYL